MTSRSGVVEAALAVERRGQAGYLATLPLAQRAISGGVLAAAAAAADGVRRACRSGRRAPIDD
ncbi:hypothetical protein ACQI5H_04895 [Mycobacterium heidelbergense]|uniref:hypothetical protein n=1 Tax=Mycobacterium heidelbergense TaxID=53376 RepID=UPI003CFAD77B